ncbi:MAG: hypothetical protein WCO98_13890 [bacterium]
MEIRRVDKELIQPAAASETGNKVEVDRRARDRNRNTKDKKEENTEEELTNEELAKFTTYSPEGHVTEKQDLSQIKHINFKA